MMKRTARLASLCVLLLLACAPIEPTLEQGPQAEVTHDGLHRVDHPRRFQRVWLKPGASLAGYSKIVTVDAGIHFTRPPKSSRDEFPISEKQIENLRGGLQQAIEEELTRGGRFTLVDQRGPEVLALRVALIDVFLAQPRESSGRDQSYGSDAGSATLVVELFDSQSLEILARIADRGVAERDSSSWRNDAITNRQAAKRLFQDWARRLGDALESAQSLASPDSTEAEVEAEPR
jgi:Protein of unknown function (DUF3313)